MRKNRKIPKRMSVVAGVTMHFGAIIAVLFLVGILYILSSTSCSQLMKSIGEKKQTLAKLDKDSQRAKAEWDGMKTPEGINLALSRLGLKMNTPSHAQVVRLNSDGTPRGGQLAVIRAKKRVDTAQLKRKR